MTLSLDGWSNIHNDPIVCIGASTTSGDFYLVDTKDTSNKHKAEYLQELVEDCLESTCATFNVDVSRFVMDNAANVAKLRRQLKDETFDDDVMLYGCGAHALNLLGKDLENKAVTDKAIQVIKYF